MFTIEVSVPYNDTVAKFRMCRLEFAYHGVNLPCIADDSAEYSSTNSDNVTDYAEWNVGPLHNFALRSSSVDEDADVIRFRAAAQLVEMTTGAEGSTVWLPVGITYSSQTVWVGHTDVVLTIGTGIDVSQVTHNYIVPLVT